MNNISAKDFPQVYEFLGIDTSKLGCIMLDTEILMVSDIIDEKDLYYTDPEKSPYTQGIVSEVVPHLTLLYGLMRSGPELRSHVDMVLAGWNKEQIFIDKVGFFYGESPDGEKYITIIGLVLADDALLEGNARLRFLPHIDTFPEYHPHITLAYVKATANWNSYVDKLNERFAGKSVHIVGINYGK